MAETETRRRPARPLPELPDEDEVDLGRYGRSLAARWWLVAAGLVAGIVVGYLVSLGSGDVYKATTVIYPGTPFTPSGGAQAPGLQTNPRTVNEIVHSAAALRTAAAVSGLRPGQVRGSVSTKTLGGGKGAAKATGQSQFVQITVQGSAPRKVALAANSLGRSVIVRIAPYVDAKIRGFENRLASLNAAISSIDATIRAQTAAAKNARGLSALDRLVLVSQLNNAQQQRAQLVQAQTDTQQLLSLARNVEKPQLIEPAVAEKTTARSPRNSMLVGGFIGLLIGIAAALLWEPLAARFGR
jgi:Chain length determinant protein